MVTGTITEEVGDTMIDHRTAIMTEEVVLTELGWSVPDQGLLPDPEQPRSPP